MAQDTTPGVTAEGHHSSTSISNQSQHDDIQPHGNAYGHLAAVHPGIDNDAAPLVAPQTNIDRYKALSRLLAFDLLITLVIAAFIAVVIKLYEQRGNLTRDQKHAFNTIITGLIVGLGLSFFEAFKSLAKRYGVWKLSNQPRTWTSEEQCLIRGSDSLMNVFTLGLSNLRSLTAVSCFAWVFLNLFAEISVALISLTYTIDDGTNWNHTYTVPGINHASNLTCYIDYFNKNPNCTSGLDGTGQTLARAYGDLALATRCCNYTDLHGVLTSKNDCRYYCNRQRNQQQFAYRFNEYNMNDTEKAYPRFTHRFITTSSGKCFNYSQDGKPEPLTGGNLLYKFHNGTFNGNITIPGVLNTWYGTTYVFRGFHSPPEADLQRCGLRCINVWAHRSKSPHNDAQIYQCPITVSAVYNATHDNHTISNGMARLAATSIALSGRMNDDKSWNQFQLSTIGSAWEAHGKEPDEVGAMMAEFAMGSIARMAYTNPPIEAHGLVPYLGSKIKVHWSYLIALLVGIASVHLLLVIGSLHFHNAGPGRDQGTRDVMATELTAYHDTHGVIA